MSKIFTRLIVFSLPLCVAWSACVFEDADVECLTNERYFQQRVWNSFMSTECFACHNAQGVANETDLVLASSNEPGFLQRNFELVREVSLLERDGTSIILLKPSAQVSHGGGEVFTEGSEKYRALETMIERFDNPVDCPDVSGGFFDDAEMLDNESTLRKATLAISGRLPNAAELDQVRAGDRQDFEAVMSGVLDEDGFYQRLGEIYNDAFLTDRYVGGNRAVDLLDEDDFPQAYWHENLDENLFSERFRDLADDNTNNSVARAPLELIKDVVRYERPFTEILTADYMMVNAYSAQVYGIEGIEFTDPSDPSEFRIGRIPGVPHAGVLSDPMFLNRFPTTDTNRNRHRSRMTFEFFLATDILSIADRPLGEENILGTNPTLFDPNCNVCHTNVDPVAGAFQNWDDRGRFRPPESGWFGDMLQPGYKDETIPPEQWLNSLQWLSQRISEDPLFSLAAVQKAYEGILGQTPLKAPADPNAPDASVKQRAFDAQSATFQEIAKRFREGGMNYKAMVVDLILSPYFRADNASEVKDEYSELGTARFLTPELLNRKISATLGSGWTRGFDGRSYLLSSSEFLIFYGGIDSDNVTNRITEPNGLMSAISTRMTNEMSCQSVPQDFFRPQADRLLFPHVEPTFAPEDSNGFEVTASTDAIRKNIQHLHQRLLGERLPNGSEELEATFALFIDTWREGAALRANDEISQDLPWRCQVRDDPSTGVELDDEQRLRRDENYTIRAWMAVVTYLLSDYRFLHE